jgi:hypothetical protein
MFSQQEEIQRVVQDPNPRKMSFVKMTGINLDTVDFNDRKTEFWAINVNTVLNSRGQISVSWDFLLSAALQQN